jgi:hypothetical protein
MPPARSKAANRSGRVAIIDAVKTPLGFFVLAVLVIETILGGLAAKGPNQLTALYGMFFFLALLIGVVAGLAFFKFDALVGKSETSEGSTKLRDFCDGLCGYWWEEIKQPETRFLSVVEVSRDSATDGLSLQGHVYGADGKQFANWDSVAVCMSPADRWVYYYWTGRIFQRPDETQEGFGRIHFSDSLVDASGYFLDANLANIKNATNRDVTYKRSAQEDEKILKNRDDKLIADLVKRKLNLAA